MIVDALLGLLYGFLSLILSFMTTQADVPTTNAITTAVSTAASYYAAMDVIFPVQTFFDIIKFELVFELIYLGYKLVRWAYRKIPGVT